jgi:alpha-tubulin suppressor-like RCC1 family protein
LFSGTGSVVAGTGVYTGGTIAGTDVVRSTDAGMNTSDATVTLIEPVQIVAGSTHYCVRYNEGSVKCWGLNTSGQLGYGDTVARGDTANESGSNLPFVNLGTGRTAKYLAAGFTHTCAILDNDTLKCWGLNSSGQLGYADAVTRGNAANQMGDSLPVVNVGTGRTVKKVAAGATHTCAILDNNTLKCWGYNLYGQIGRDNTTNAGNTAGSMGDTLAVVNIGVGRTAKDVSGGLDHTCVILDDNTLKCFGRNNRGQLGKLVKWLL